MFASSPDECNKFSMKFLREGAVLEGSIESDPTTIESEDEKYDLYFYDHKYSNFIHCFNF